MDGSFQRSGSRLRLTVQVIEVAEGRSLWAGKVDAEIDDLFSLQDEVAHRVVSALQVRLTPHEENALGREPAPAGAANEAYFKGRFHLSRETMPDTFAAIEWFDRARREAPDSALVWAATADAFSRMAFTFEPEGDWFERARQACARALELDADLPEARYVKARLLWSPQGGFDHAGSIEQLAAVLIDRPNLGPACERLGTILFHVGMLEEAECWLERAREIEPDDMVPYLHLGLCRYYQGRFEEARRISREAGRRSPSAWARCQAALAAIQLDDLEAARGEIESGARQFPDYAFFHSIGALIAARGGRRDEALAAIERTEAFERYGHYHHAQHDVACAWAQLGEPDRALEWLEQAAAFGFPCHRFFAVDPQLAPLRGQAGFEALLGRLREETAGYKDLHARLFDRPPA